MDSPHEILVIERDSTSRSGAGRNAVQRDRCRAIALALDGEMTRTIEAKLGRSRAFVQRWVCVCRDEGLDAARPGTAPGAPCKRSAGQIDRSRRRGLAGPREDDGVCTLRGRDFQRILRE